MTIRDDRTLCRAIAALCCMDWQSARFGNLLIEAERDGVFVDCRTVGDYAQKLLGYRLDYLIRLSA